MTDQNPLPGPEAPRITEGEHRHAGRWVPGLILIVLGAIFLLNNLANFQLNNWWALFILIPAVSSFVRAYDQYRRAGRLDRHARQSMFGGLLLTAVAAIFLFNLNWTLFGPILLILLGLTLLGNDLLP
jgi:hypothetical protein